MRLRDNPILYLAIYSLITKFIFLLISLQFFIFLFYYPIYELSLTFYMCCVILWLCDEYVIGLLVESKFKIEDYINDL